MAVSDMDNRFKPRPGAAFHQPVEPQPRQPSKRSLAMKRNWEKRRAAEKAAKDATE